MTSSLPVRRIVWTGMTTVRILSRGGRLVVLFPALPDRQVPGPPWSVFLSHTSDLRDHPAERSFVAAAEAAVIRTRHAVIDMAYFAPSDAACAEHCAGMIATADVYVGIVGNRYGSTVPGRADLSFTELEFQTATLLGLPRLIFLIREDCLPPIAQPAAHRARQAAFRRRLQDGAVLASRVASPAELELQLLQALGDLRTEWAARAAFSAAARDLL